MSEEEKTYEMFWDCEYCGSQKLLGKTHRHCPVCGAKQNPDKRYFPEDSEKVAVEDHEYAGVDQLCPACGTACSAAVKFCVACGAPMDGSESVKLVQDESEEENSEKSPKEEQKNNPTTKKKSSLFKKIIFGGILSVIVLILLAIFWKKEVGFEVTSHSWTRTINIEDFRPRSESRWCDEMPIKAYSITRSKEVRSHEKVEDGQDCHTKKVDKGNGTYKEEKVCETRYKSVPVYDMKCRYKIDRWKKARSVNAKGSSLAESPVWPKPILAQNTGKYGAERIGTKSESYTVHLKAVKGDSKTCNFDQNKWQSMNNGSKWKGKVGVITGSLDCNSLLPLK